ncbi:GNAT family N-acetyltransferase [Tabrizicola caldifontis]|uniref:GNAT family N-acetyltransferase n=1 Tax=Tabrizicola caldifontis TaxID=2528036 RepID=UPI0010800E35|nr:GNAT family protein [Rhodobacter sp. YIM 73028]
MLRPATAADIGFIRSLTTRPDYAPFIGDADEAQLRAWIDDPSVRVLIWEGVARGFAIFRSADQPVVELFRIALDRAGGGHGDAFFRALVDHAFRDLGAERLWLDASAENARAIKVYTRAGFRQEGRLRAHWFRPALGRAVDLILMGMLRSEWQALEATSARA